MRVIVYVYESLQIVTSHKGLRMTSHYSEPHPQSRHASLCVWRHM